MPKMIVEKSFFAEGSPAIILPSRMFQIGDTIKANFTKLK
jgi:hypothetical protein